MKNKSPDIAETKSPKTGPQENAAYQFKLSVVVVNYNVKYFLEQALQSLFRASRNLNLEVFVVDNNSSDGSVKMVRDNFPAVKLIENEKNAGFSAANNQAIKEATGEYILLLNPDTVVEEDSFEKILEFMDLHPNAGGLGVRMIDGKGNFLPESKRSFPSPFVAFSKAFGLSRLFPKSKTFNKYHLGYLDERETHEVEVLSGAFMLLRRSVLDQIGLLDETFFMYGEDIDLSYRIIQAGYKNYYFSGTTIIHYKGESTKKGSLNYVRIFYKAMIIFSRKHFQGEGAWMLVGMLRLAIYFRAILSIVKNLFKYTARPLMDAVIIAGGLYILKEFWENAVYQNPEYFLPVFLKVNLPLYTSIWIASIFFSGGYDEPYNIKRLLRGIGFGTLILAAIYGFLPLDYRTSRALIILGAFWSFIGIWIIRLTGHFWHFKNFKLDEKGKNNLIIIGSEEESQRVRQLIHQAEISKNFIGTVAAGNPGKTTHFLGSISELDEIVYIYKVNEIIFCSQDIPSRSIMQWMTKLGPLLDYKIVPEKSLSIIGSNSKNTSGDLYTIDIRFKINDPVNVRNKRTLDIILSIILLTFIPLYIWFIRNMRNLPGNLLRILSGKYSFVGYLNVKKALKDLPQVKPGILTPVDALKVEGLDKHTIERLNFLYAKDYSIESDFNIIFKGFKDLGRKTES